MSQLLGIRLSAELAKTVCTSVPQTSAHVASTSRSQISPNTYRLFKKQLKKSRKKKKKNSKR